jgi:hypothetical protein
MPDDRETITKLIEELAQGLTEGTLTPEQEENLRDEISGLQMNIIIGDLLID